MVSVSAIAAPAYAPPAAVDEANWLLPASKHFSAADQAMLQRALDAFSDEGEALSGEQRKLALASADLLAQLHADAPSLAAVLLEALPNSKDRQPRLMQAFGAEVAGLAAGLERIAQIESLTVPQPGPAGNARAQAGQLEVLRKMLLAMAQDVRVVVLKLVRTVCRLRDADTLEATERARLARLSLDLFAPLANRLGAWQLKWELEDLAFSYLEPERYQEIADWLKQRRSERERYVEATMQTLSDELKRAGLAADVMGRPKHIYSIHRKLLRKRVDLAHVYDTLALRVVMLKVDDCYAALSVTHNLWAPIAGEFDDYIAHPKDNRYRSLHTAVIGPEQRALEVQIRTREMHHAAEFGIAAHWRYKENRRADARYDDKIAWLRQVLDWRNELSGNVHMRERFGQQAFDDSIFVLTPQGKVIDLPRDSTAVDFAYQLHTELGHRCRGARVDGHMVPLNYKLQNAQRVEIIAAKTGGPSRDWLNPALGLLHTSRALAKVRQWFKQQELAQDIASGRAALDKELHRAGAGNVALDPLSARLGFAHTDEFLAALGRSELTSRQVQLALRDEPASDSAPLQADSTPSLPGAAPATPTASSGILVLGVNNIATLLAKCCKPVPPDAILGFVTKGRGVTVHRSDCANLAALRPEQRERVMSAQWGDLTGSRDARFAVDISLEADDRQGLLRDVSEVFAREKINVTATRTLSRNDRAMMRFTAQISDRAHLERVIDILGRVPNVVRVGRSA